MNTRNHTYRRYALLLLTLSFGIKAFIPVGYMPTSVGDGWPVAICFSGLPEELHDVLGGGHSHSESDDDSRWQHCPLGAFSASFAVATEHREVVVDRRKGFAPFVVVKPSTTDPLFGFRSRAPPCLVRIA